MATKKEKTEKKAEYFEAVGRRKTSIARVRMTKASEFSILINKKSFTEYFPVAELRAKVLSPLKTAQMENSFSVEVMAKGGGISSQADAVSHGIARALVVYDSELRKNVKKGGHLKRDPRMKERRKFGLKKARKAPQWSKR